jgi:hypothetical protein
MDSWAYSEWAEGEGKRTSLLEEISWLLQSYWHPAFRAGKGLRKGGLTQPSFYGHGIWGWERSSTYPRPHLSQVSYECVPDVKLNSPDVIAIGNMIWVNAGRNISKIHIFFFLQMLNELYYCLYNCQHYSDTHDIYVTSLQNAFLEVFEFPLMKKIKEIRHLWI